MKTSHTDSQFQKVADWLPLGLIVFGLVLTWIKVPFSGVILMAGFLTYGIFGIIISIKHKYYRGISMRLFKLVNDVAIIILVAGYFMGQNTTWFLLMLILLDRLILLPRASG